MSKVIYTSGSPRRRYAVEFYMYGKWNRSRETYRTRVFAMLSADSFASIGHRARVIDTRGEMAA